MRQLVVAVTVTVAVLAAACADDTDRAESQGPASTTTSAPGLDTTTSVPECAVEPAEVWLTEGDTARGRIDCDVAVQLDDAPVGVEIVDDELVWTPAFDQAGVHDIEISGEGVTLRWTVAVADAFDDPANVPIVEPERHTHEHGLAVMQLFTGEALSTDFAGADLVHDGRTTPIELRVRGSLSLQYPKPNFTLRFDEPFESADPTFDGLERLVLVAGFDDNSSMRNRLAQQLWADMAPAHLAVGHHSVVVYLDGGYLGVYTLLEPIDEQYPGRHGLEPAGQLFKAEDARADFRLDDDPDPRAGFEKKSGEPADGPAALGPIADLVEFVAGADDGRFAAELGEWVDVDDLLDWFVFVSFISAGDSANKNAYWFQSDDRTPFRYLPWDFNHSFGQSFHTRRLPADEQLVADFAVLNGLFERLWADPELRRALLERYDELLAGPLRPDALHRHIDAISGELGENLTRNDQRWHATYADFRLWADRDDVNTAPDEIDAIRRWIEDRHAAISAEVAASSALA